MQPLAQADAYMKGDAVLCRWPALAGHHDVYLCRRVVEEGSRLYRDVRYRGLVVELDGGLYHPPDEREHDDRRDADLLQVEGIRTVRYGWRAVKVAPCRTAAQVAALLRQAGVAVTIRACGPGCTATGAG